MVGQRLYHDAFWDCQQMCWWVGVHVSKSRWTGWLECIIIPLNKPCLPGNKELCMCYCRKIAIFTAILRSESRYKSEQIIFLDDVGFSVSTRTKRGRTKKGSKVSWRPSDKNKKNFYFFAAMSKNRMLLYKIYDFPTNGVIFKAYSIDLNNTRLNTCFLDFFCLDNARQHISLDWKVRCKKNK